MRASGIAGARVAERKGASAIERAQKRPRPLRESEAGSDGETRVRGAHLLLKEERLPPLEEMSTHPASATLGYAEDKRSRIAPPCNRQATELRSSCLSSGQRFAAIEPQRLSGDCQRSTDRGTAAWQRSSQASTWCSRQRRRSPPRPSASAWPQLPGSIR